MAAAPRPAAAVRRRAVLAATLAAVVWCAAGALVDPVAPRAALWHAHAAAAAQPVLAPVPLPAAGAGGANRPEAPDSAIHPHLRKRPAWGLDAGPPAPWALLAVVAAFPLAVAGLAAAVRALSRPPPAPWLLLPVAATAPPADPRPAVLGMGRAPAIPAVNRSEAYQVAALLSTALSPAETELRLTSLEALFVQHNCKRTTRADRGVRLLAAPVRGHTEAQLVLYTLRGPHTLPALVDEWLVSPGPNADGRVYRCLVAKRRRQGGGGAQPRQ